MYKNRNYQLILIVTFLVMFFSVKANALSIADSVEMAVDSNPDIQAAYAAQLGQKEVVAEKRSDFFPVLNADVNFEAMRVNDDNTRGTTSGEADNGYAGEGSIRISQMVYDGKNVSNTYKAEQNRFQASKYEAIAKTGDIAIAAIAAHLNVLRMRELEYITGLYLDDLKEYESRVRDMVEGGASDQAELLQIREIKAVTHNTLLNYQEQKQFSEADYLQIVGQLPDNNITISDKDMMAGNAIPENIDTALNIVKEQHPALRSIVYTVDALGLDIQAEKALKYPRVDAEISHLKKDQKDGFGGEIEDSSALLRMSWNFETGGAQKSRVSKRYQDRKSTRMRMKSIERELEQKLRKTMARYDISLERLELQTKRKKTNKDILSNYKSQFEGGKRSLLEIVNIRNQSYRANTEYTNAYYSYYLSQFELLNALGILQKTLKN